jgi:hypothetical protein
MDFAPAELDFIADPYPAYTRLREWEPVRYDEATDHWLISRYEDVNALLRDRRVGRTYRHLASHAEMGHPDPPEWHAPFWDLINAGILDMEPPNHTRVRRLVAKAFTPRFVEGLRPRVQAIMDGLVDGLDGAGEFDLIRVGRAASRHGDRRDARGSRGRPPPPASVVRRHLQDVRAEPFDRDAARRGPSQQRVLGLPARARARAQGGTRART